MFLPDPSGHRDVALAVVRDAGRLLLVRNARSAQGLAVAFEDLPGGTVEPGERVGDALVREVREETGLSVAVGALRLVVDGAKRAAPGAEPLYTWRAFVFEADAPAGAAPVAGPEIEAAAFVALGEALARMQAPYQRPVVDWLRGDERRGYLAFDWIEAPPEVPLALTPRLRHLLIAAAAAAAGDLALVAKAAETARAEGVAVADLEETLLQIVPYAGFPRALAAFAAARPVLGPTSAVVEGAAGTRGPTGEAAFRTVYGPTADRVAAGLASLHPLLPAWTRDFAYGRVLSRPALGPVEREVLAAAILTALGRVDDALLGHLRAALRLGATRDTLAGAIAVVPPSVGAGKRAAARTLLARA